MAYIKNGNLKQSDIDKLVTRLVEEYCYENTIHRASQPGTVARVESPSGEEIEFYTLPAARRGLERELSIAAEVLARVEARNAYELALVPRIPEQEAEGTGAGDYTFSYEAVWGIDPDDPIRRTRQTTVIKNAPSLAAARAMFDRININSVTIKRETIEATIGATERPTITFQYRELA
jgi:hypothetical protein